MISAIFTQITAIITAFGTLLGNVFSRGIAMFWDSEGSTLTALGTLALVGLGSGLLIWGFHYVRSLIRVKTK